MKWRNGESTDKNSAQTDAHRNDDVPPDALLAVGGAATLFAISTDGIPEAVAAHPPRKVVMFDGRIVAPDGAVLPPPARTT